MEVKAKTEYDELKRGNKDNKYEEAASVEEILTQWRLGVWKRGRKTTYRH